MELVLRRWSMDIVNDATAVESMSTEKIAQILICALTQSVKIRVEQWRLRVCVRVAEEEK